MEYKVRWTPNAADDFVDLANTIQEFVSLNAAKKFIDKTFAAISLLKQFPLLGKESKKLPGLRRLILLPHVAMWYQIHEDSIVLLNFFDTRRDPTTSLFN